MTHARILHLVVVATLAVALTLTLALARVTTPASARTFGFSATGSLVQQPLPPQFACALRRALSNRTFPCLDVGVR